jgi:hypothetical protein
MASNILSKGALLLLLLTLAVPVLQGCHDWPDERGTAIEAQSILQELSRVETVPDPNIPIPEIYTLPPKKAMQVVGGKEEWKLFYFCRYHTAEVMKKIIHEQFATVLFDDKGKSTQVTDYTVTASIDTNQLIVRCPTEADVDAVLEVITNTDVPPVQVRIECMVSEMYADLTVDRETSMLIQNLFGESIELSGDPSNDYLAFPGAALRDPARERFGLKIGVSTGDEGHRFEALVDILVSRGYLKILMNPTLEVVNGQTANIQSSQHVPLQEVTVQSGGFGGVPVLRTQTEYYDIVDELNITPHVYADGYIGLETSAQIAAYLTPEGIKQVPIVTERRITNKENRIRHGESLIIGGIRKSEKRDVIRGVPILKDIPGLNLLFSGRDFEERATEVIFILTPTISTSGQPNSEIVEMLREKHASPLPQGLHETVMDPLGFRAREEEQDRQLESMRDARQQLEAENAQAELEVVETKRRLGALQAQLEAAEARNADSEVAQAEIEQEMRQTRQRIEALQVELERAQARGAAAETQIAQAEAEKAAEAERSNEQSAPSMGDSENAGTDAEPSSQNTTEQIENTETQVAPTAQRTRMPDEGTEETGEGASGAGEQSES